MEMRGDVREGLRPSGETEEGRESMETDDGKVYYVVHPQVDLTDLSSTAE